MSTGFPHNPKKLMAIAAAAALSTENVNGTADPVITTDDAGNPLPLPKKRHLVGITTKLNPGMAWNPLVTLPRNMPCPCDSGKKYKHCHLPVMPRAIPEKLAAEYAEQIKGASFESLKFEGDPLEDDSADSKPNA